MGVSQMNISGTREEILGEIKKAGEISIPELTKKLNIVTNAVRGHMVLLEKENLVQYRWVRQKKGRPLKIYKLSEQAEIHFPKKYDFLLSELIDEIIEEDGIDKFKHILNSLSKKWANRFKIKQNIEGLSNEDILKSYVDYLNEQGYLASLQKTNSSYTISLYNCIYRNASRRHRELCNIKLSIIKDLVNAKVDLITTVHDDSPCCVLNVKWH